MYGYLISGWWHINLSAFGPWNVLRAAYERGEG